MSFISPTAVAIYLVAIYIWWSVILTIDFLYLKIYHWTWTSWNSKAQYYTIASSKIKDYCIKMRSWCNSITGQKFIPHTNLALAKKFHLRPLQTLKHNPIWQSQRGKPFDMSPFLTPQTSLSHTLICEWRKRNMNTLWNEFSGSKPWGNNCPRLHLFLINLFLIIALQVTVMDREGTRTWQTLTREGSPTWVALLVPGQV